MVNTRVTHASLLVDRVVSRNACVTAEFLLVDKTVTRNAQISSVAMVADYTTARNAQISSLALIVDYVTSYYVVDSWLPTSEFTFEWTPAYQEASYIDTWSVTSTYDYEVEVIIEDGYEDEQTQEDEFEVLHLLCYQEEVLDEWGQLTYFAIDTHLHVYEELIEDIFDTYSDWDASKFQRADVYAYGQDIIDHINQYGVGWQPDADHLYLDMSDDGILTLWDSLLVNWWWSSGLIYKFRTDNWTPTENWHWWPTTSVSLSTSWTQTSTFTSDLQHLGYTDAWPQLEVWNNPGTRNIALSQTWSQTDSFTFNYLDQYFRDNFNFDESWDTVSKSRTWTDIWVQTDRFSIDNIYDHWTQIDSFRLEAQVLAIRDAWTQTDTFKIPHTRTWVDTWTPQEIYTDTALHSDFIDNFVQTESWATNAVNVVWTESAQQLSLLGGNYIVTGMVSWLAYTLDRVRTFNDIINWSERWAVELAPVAFETTWAQTDSFDNEILWEAWSDELELVETWTPLVYTHDLTQSFDFISAFEALLNSNRVVSDTLSWQSNFSVYAPITTFSFCPPGTKGKFTLIDSQESLVLRNADWGNPTRLEFIRVIGTSRSGTPVVLRDIHKPQRVERSYNISGLSDAQCAALLAFIERNIGKKIYWIDHTAAFRAGYITEPATQVTRVSNKRSSVKLTLIEISSEVHDILTDFTTAENWVWELS